MKNKDIKNLIKKEYENLNTPFLSPKIKEEPIQQKPPFNDKKAITPKTNYFKFSVAIVSCLLIISLTFIAIFKDNKKQSELTSYILEINPSLCITTDTNDEILSLCSLSSDGDNLLSDARFDNIVGKNLDDGLKTIIEASVDNGYFENYNRPIILFAINNQEDFAFEKSRHFEKFLNKHLKEFNLENIKIDKGCMSIPDFKDRMDFHNDFEDLDKMREELKNRPKYFNKDFLPPPPPRF